MKITFIGAGSTVFAKNILGDCILTPEIGSFEIALYDIDVNRMEESSSIINAINKYHNGKAVIKKYTDIRAALSGSDFVINAIQVGGYIPATYVDFEIPKKYGLRQTIGDTLGIGGLFRALRTIPVMEQHVRIMEEVCPHAYYLNYTNPIASIMGYIQANYSIKSVGLCHSVQYCLPSLSDWLNLPQLKDNPISKIAGINHMSWLLEIADKNGNDLYPAIKKAMKEINPSCDRVRGEIMDRFGYYNTESSEHTAEYHPWFIKSKYPELIEKYNIPLDEYPRRCVDQIKKWELLRVELTKETSLKHEKSAEFGSHIIQAISANTPYTIHGNVLNNGLITNLPAAACVEVPIVVSGNGFCPSYIGALPEQCAALNRTSINVQLLTREAAKSKKKDDVYMAAYLDPHTAAELSLDDIKSMCDELFEAHNQWLPLYK